ncbi:MAG: aminopeptidase P family protein [Sedimentisphaerales bacterium]|nr:aminopeptidase P family protein [Sedimentisphaerales bacterium]
MSLKKYISTIAVFILINASCLQSFQTTDQGIYGKILPLKERAAIQNEWLKWRLENILPELMRNADIDLWLIINREYNEDAVYFTLSPQPTIYSYRTTILMLHDKGGELGVEGLSASDYGYGRLYRGAFTDRSKKQFENLADVIQKIDPEKIGINTSETWHLADGLNTTMKKRLESALGPEMSKRMVSAEKLCIDWLQIRSPQELEAYNDICSIAHEIIREGSSDKNITPDVTTIDDVRWWFRHKIAELGLEAWFHPVCDIQRKKEDAAKYRDNPNIIRRGDLIHCDLGIKYLGLCTDMQWHIYVCRGNETDAPEGLKNALNVTLEFGKILTGEFKEGRTGDEIAKAATKKAEAAGINSQIYSHSIGNYGHSAGTRLDTRPLDQVAEENRDRTQYAIPSNTVYAIEYCCFFDIPEWDNQQVKISFEDDAAFTKDGCNFLDGHQQDFFLIK